MHILKTNEYLKSAKIYNALGEKYQEGYCYLLLSNESKASDIWYSANISSPVLWGRALLDIINSQINNVPTFLQIRNYLEVDIGNFIKSENTRYAEALIDASDFLADINLETYKFIGRTLMNNGYLSLGMDYLVKSQKTLRNDPEIYYYLAQYCQKAGSLCESKKMLNKCLELNIYFTPARKMLEKIEIQMSNS